MGTQAGGLLQGRAIVWALRIPEVSVQAPGYAGPDAILNSWAGMLAWLPAQAGL